MTCHVVGKEALTGQVNYEVLGGGAVGEPGITASLRTADWF